MWYRVVYLSLLFCSLSVFGCDSVLGSDDDDDQEKAEACVLTALLCQAQPVGSDGRARCDGAAYLTCFGTDSL